MKQIILFFGSIIIACASMAQDVMVVNDKNAQVRTISGSFHGIKISNAIDVIIKQGNDEAVVVSATEDKYRDRIKTEVKDGILRIWFDNEGWNWKWNMGDKKLRAYVSVKDIDMLDVSGACDVKVDGSLSGNSLQLKLSGASSFKATLKYSKMTVNQSGASDAVVSGVVPDISIELSGASDFKGYDLVTENCTANASGASDMKITVNKELRVNASGASDVDYKGNAVISSFRSSGASSVRKRSK